MEDIQRAATHFLKLLKQKDSDTYQHSLRVGNLSKQFAKYLHFSKEDQEIARLAGLLHDIGKLQIPDAILKKPDSLTPKEYEIVKFHSIYGHDLFCKHFPHSKKKAVKLVGEAILHHHENFAGTGYPSSIPIGQLSYITSIVSVCDVFDAIISKRCYKPAYPKRETLAIMEREKNKQFKADWVDKFSHFIIHIGA